MSVTTAPIQRLLTLRELESMGYGSRKTNQLRITKGLLPAVMVGNRYKIRESDLHLLAVPINNERNDDQ